MDNTSYPHHAEGQSKLAASVRVNFLKDHRMHRISTSVFVTLCVIVGYSPSDLVRVTVPVMYPIMLPAGIDFHWDFQLPPFSSVVKRGADESRNHIFSLPKRTEVTFIRRFSMKTATPVAYGQVGYSTSDSEIGVKLVSYSPRDSEGRR